jgi:hypothetical protein
VREDVFCSFKGFYCLDLRSKNEVLCAAAGRLAAERSEADKPPKHIKPFTYYFFFKPS